MNKDDIDELFTFMNENSYFDNSDDEKMENYVNTFNALIESNKQMESDLDTVKDLLIKFVFSSNPADIEYVHLALRGLQGGKF